MDARALVSLIARLPTGLLRTIHQPGCYITFYTTAGTAIRALKRRECPGMPVGLPRNAARC